MTEQSDLEKITKRVQTMLAVAAQSNSPEEAASFMAKAQEYLAAYNLDMSTIEQGGGTSGKREDARVRGGMYVYERELWAAVADLNWCVYFASRTVKWDNSRKRIRFEHRVVGRVVNTTTTKGMADYLLGTIERLCSERFPLNTQRFLREAVAYREGMADNVVERLQERRNDALEKERLAKERAERAARKKGLSTSTTLTLSGLADSEKAANYDFMHGEGAWARKEAERAKWEADAPKRRAARAKADAAAEKAYAAWAAAHPQEAAKEAARERANERARERREASGGGYGRYRAPSDRERRQSRSDYHAGYEAGGKIGLDPQAESAQPVRRLK